MNKTFKHIFLALIIVQSLNLYAGSDIIVGQSTSTGKIKKILTSTPAKVIYALLGIGTATAIGWIIYQARCRRHSLSYAHSDADQSDNTSNSNAAMYDGSQDVKWVQDSLNAVNLDGYELNKLFNKNGQDIQNYFFPNKSITYSTSEKMAFKHNFSLNYYKNDNTQLMRLLDALEDCNAYRLSRSQEKINFYVFTNDDNKITTISFNPPND